MTRPGSPYDMGGFDLQKSVEECCFVDDIPYCKIKKPLRSDFRDPTDYMLASTSEIKAKLQELKPDCVVAASNHIVAIPALLAARSLGIPFIYEVRVYGKLLVFQRTQLIIIHWACLIRFGLKNM